jgi:hypothetical protein
MTRLLNKASMVVVAWMGGSRQEMQVLLMCSRPDREGVSLYT